ncbi:MAG TPA: hypothetical protein VIV12_25550 [Streptosporangiaceae bacterium]
MTVSFLSERSLPTHRGQPAGARLRAGKYFRHRVYAAAAAAAVLTALGFTSAGAAHAASTAAGSNAASNTTAGNTAAGRTAAGRTAASTIGSLIYTTSQAGYVTGGGVWLRTTA